MDRKKIILIFLGISVLFSAGSLFLFRYFWGDQNFANYQVTEITSDCEKESDSKGKEDCYQQLFVIYNSQKNKDCSIFPNSSVAVCEKAKLIEEAFYSKNEGNCLRLSEENEQLACETQVLFNLAISNREVKYCEKIKQPEVGSDCRLVLEKIKSSFY